jgi:O-antigen ligase
MRQARVMERGVALGEGVGLREPRPIIGWLLLSALVLATVVAGLVGNGDLKLALAPSILALVVCLVAVLPLRVPMLTLLVLAWALEVPGDAFAEGLVHTPWRMVGALLFGRLNQTLPVGPLVMSGFDFLVLLMFGVLAYRHHQRSMIDRRGWVDSPAPIRSFAWLSVLAVAWMCVWGFLHGGAPRFMFWQSLRWLYLPIIYALMRQALRGMPDALTVGKLLLGVGLFRAGEAILFRSWYPSVEVMGFATTHFDTVLFATCLAILGALLLEMPSPATFRLAVLLSPIYYWAIRANNRRLAYADLALIALVFWFITPWRPLKRRAARILALGALPILLYVGVGWTSEAGPFGPVQKFRSMLDPKADTSTLWRELENTNLVFTYHESPLLGLGFGRAFHEHIKLPDVTGSYELEPYVPHNSVLGLWAFGGLLGFSLLWALFPVGFFFTARAYRWASTPMERVTALGAAAVQICYLIQGYADLGFGSWGPVFTVATSYALVGKICLANGAWGRARAEDLPAGGPEIVAPPRPERA